ncbi:DUF5919 domain-containing protein [Crossiella sp. CA-258035]|uniref:DUF5919 domain-containing protein n=1 Tax=Crossiella sp. CA-258035 TaxID=2981138 RepID=UPI0024BC4C52|nr:DUF5919 domain-containing protein [Crossiella sp. CA-258035]WHT21183.1 DUF5919 domain-containing protein [Crossiella sp. CA-258035]
MTPQPTLLKYLLRQRHLQGYRAFCKEYDRVAKKVDPDLRGKYPSKAQFYRWLSGELIGLPYPDHCRILEAMLPGHGIEALLSPHDPDTAPPIPQAPPAALPAAGAGTAPVIRPAATEVGEIVSTYPHRNAIPSELWDRLTANATGHVEVLVHAALFLTERPTFVRSLATKAAKGAKIRLLFGDPASPEVALRSDEEGLGAETLGGRIRNALAFYRPLQGVDGVEIRFHRTTLYNSIFRFDHEMIVNTHVYGFQGAHAPALHLRSQPTQGLFDIYAESFETVWNLSTPADF